MDAPALRALVAQLREALAVRERQIERKAEEVAQMQARPGGGDGAGVLRWGCWRKAPWGL